MKLIIRPTLVTQGKDTKTYFNLLLFLLVN